MSVGHSKIKQKETAMSEKINFNTKGDTYVIPDDDFNIQEAGVERSKKADWNDFELMGANNREEGEYVAPVETDPVKMEAALERIKKRKIGLSILSAMRNAA